MSLRGATVRALSASDILYCDLARAAAMSRRQVAQDVSHVLPGCTDAERKALAAVPSVYKKIKRMKRRSGAVVNQPLRIRILNSSLPTDVQEAVQRTRRGFRQQHAQYAEGIEVPRAARPCRSREDPTDYLLRARVTLEAMSMGKMPSRAPVRSRRAHNVRYGRRAAVPSGPPGNGKTTLLRR